MKTAPISIVGDVVKGAAGSVEGFAAGGSYMSGERSLLLDLSGTEVIFSEGLSRYDLSTQISAGKTVRVLADLDSVSGEQTNDLNDRKTTQSEFRFGYGAAYDFDKDSPYSVYLKGHYNSFSESRDDSEETTEGSVSMSTFELGGSAIFGSLKVGGHFATGAAGSIVIPEDEDAGLEEEKWGKSVNSTIGVFGLLQVLPGVTFGGFIENNTPQEEDSTEDDGEVAEEEKTVESSILASAPAPGGAWAYLCSLDLSVLRVASEGSRGVRVLPMPLAAPRGMVGMDTEGGAPREPGPAL